MSMIHSRAKTVFLNRASVLAVLPLAFVLSSVALAEEGRNQGQSQKSSETKAASQAPPLKQGQMQGQTYEIVEFKKGTSELDAQSKRKLETLMKKAQTSGEVDQVHVAVWSDKQFPKGEGQELPERDQKLAENRVEAIDQYLSDQLKVENVETYSLAERSNWFARAISTDEAELKSLFSQEGAPADVDPQELRIVKSKGGPSKAVILIEMKEDSSRKPASQERNQG